VATVDIEIEDGRITARASGRLDVWSAADFVVLHGSRIVSIGESGDPSAPVRPNEGIVRRAAFDPRRFDPNLAVSILRFAIARSGALGFARPDLRIRWRGWQELDVGARRALITGIGSQRIEINGVPVVRPRIDLPVLRALFGELARPDPAGPWTSRRR
jgi:hypothetical protein